MRKPKGYWNKENVFALAKTCGSRKEIERKSRRAYEVARRNGWLDEMTWLKEKIETNTYTKEIVFEEAKKYSSLSAFRKGDINCYNGAVKHGWLAEINKTLFNKVTYPTKEEVFEVSKKYKTLIEFEKNDPQMYSKAERNKWLNEMPWITKKQHSTYNNEDKDFYFEKAKQYRTKKEFSEKDYCLYRMMQRRGWLKEMDWFIPKEEQELYTVYVFYLPFNAVYVGITCDFQRRMQEHSEQDTAVHRFCKKFNITSTPLVQHQSGFTASAAQEKEDELVKYFYNKGCMILNEGKTGKYVGSLGGFGTKWSKNVVLNEARKYKSLRDFRKNADGAYQKACRKKWIIEIREMYKN